MFQSLKKTAAETHRMLQKAFGDNAMSQRNTFLWYKRFRNGWTSVENDERSGRPSTCTTPENIANVREVILADRRQTIHDVCEIGLSYGTVQRILADNLNMRRISARFVPWLLSDEQKTLRVFLCRELKQQARDDPIFISNIITGDETWVYGYDPETKQQSSQWNSPISQRPKKSASSSQHCQVHVDHFFSICKALSTRNSYPMVKPSMASYTVRFWSGWGRAFGANLQTSERKTNGFSTMKTRPFTHHLFDSSWIPKTLQWFPTPLFTWPVTFSYSPRWNYSWKDFVLTQLGRSTHKMQEVIDTLTSENFQGCMKSWETCWDHWYMLKRDYFEGDSGK